MDVNFNGLEELTQRIRSFQNTQEFENQALMEAGKHMKKELEKTAPVRTGKLKGNILMSEIKDNKIDVGTSQQGNGFYGFFLEYGTSTMNANPWARPAWEMNKQKVKDIMAEELRKGLGL